MREGGGGGGRGSLCWGGGLGGVRAHPRQCLCSPLPCAAAPPPPCAQGRKAKFVPGWDTHGLPIELKVLQVSRA